MEQIKIFKKYLILFFAFFASSIASAQNIGFESGNLNGWTAAGTDVYVSTGVQNVTYGDNKIWTIMPYGSYMAELYPSGVITFDDAVINLGLTSVENQSIRNFMIANAGGGDPNPTNATWIKRTINLQAGVTYTFAWNYLSTDYAPFNDGSLMSLVHKTNSNIIPTLNNNQQRYALLGFTNPGSGNYSTGSYGSTGWQLAVFTVPENGQYELGFATFNLGDTVLSPILFIDEIQGTTLLNGQPFGPIEPNPGSNAPSTGGGETTPTLCCGGSSNQFNANSGFTERAAMFSSSNSDNKVLINQIGNNNVITVSQTGMKNYSEIYISGSNNSVNTIQNSIFSNNYYEASITGNFNIINLNQSSEGGTKGIYLISNDSINAVTVNQSGTGNHYAEINLIGGNKTVDVTQSGTVGHMVKIELTGGATSIITTQQGITQQFYSINHNCAQTSCSAITVTQGQ